MNRPFARLTDDEVDMLSRALMESSCVIVMGDEKTDSRYSVEEVKTHNELLNMVSEERKRRGFWKVVMNETNRYYLLA